MKQKKPAQKLKIGDHTIFYANGDREEIFVGFLVQGTKKAVLFQTKSKPRSAFKLLQYFKATETWGVVNMHKPLLHTPVRLKSYD